MQEQLIAKKAKFYVIDAYGVARDAGMGSRMNTIMQVCFFAISKVLPREEAIEAIRESIRHSYGKKGEEVVQKNLHAVDETLSHLFEVSLPPRPSSRAAMPAPFSIRRPSMSRDVLGTIYRRPRRPPSVSAFPPDGTFPTGTAKWEKRNIALEIPVWDTKTCIQCGKCAMVCPHAVIRIKVYDQTHLENAPETFKSVDARDKEWQGMKYTIQVAPEDCTGCGICVDICPAKNKSETRLKAIHMEPQPPLRIPERSNWEFFLKLPELDRSKIKLSTIRQQQVQEPLFEFSGACAGCGETPYVKLVSQLFGDRAVIANATGCSSIYGGNLPTTPWTKNSEGRGPAWSNSLFEDNAEFGLGFRVSIDKQTEFARELLRRLAPSVGENIVDLLLNAPQQDEADIAFPLVRTLTSRVVPAPRSRRRMSSKWFTSTGSSPSTTVANATRVPSSLTSTESTPPGHSLPSSATSTRMIDCACAPASNEAIRTNEDPTTRRDQRRDPISSSDRIGRRADAATKRIRPGRPGRRRA